MVAQHAVDPTLPGLSDVIESLRKATFGAAAATPYEQEIRRATSRALVERLIWLAGGAPMPQVRADRVERARGGFSPAPARLARPAGPETAWRSALMAADIKRFLERPIEPVTVAVAPSTRPRARRSAATPAWTGSRRRPGGFLAAGFRLLALGFGLGFRLG